MEPVGSSAMMIRKALVIYNLWTLCWYLNLRCDFHFLINDSVELTDRNYLQFIHIQISTVYPHKIFIRFSSSEKYFWCEKVSYILHVFTNTLHSIMSFTTPYIPHLFIQIWCKHRVELVIIKVFLTIYFSAFFVQLKNMCTGNHYIFFRCI